MRGSPIANHMDNRIFVILHIHELKKTEKIFVYTHAKI
jgi:hypothetical protein